MESTHLRGFFVSDILYQDALGEGRQGQCREDVACMLYKGRACERIFSSEEVIEKARRRGSDRGFALPCAASIFREKNRPLGDAIISYTIYTMEFLPTIGLEIHAELKTETKMFCRSPNDPDEKRPNVNICPICMGHPGTLPTINKEAVGHIVKVGKAIGGEVADFTQFERKHYFYPDIPKGYQISQYRYPIVRGGSLDGVVITRVHLEEDTARSTHDAHDESSLVDFNRAGIPLMELVTEPVIKSAKEAGDFARELQLLLRYLEVSEANMEKGEMRVEANVSVAPAGSKDDTSSLVLGTKVEVKNLNSFRVVERAIEYEIKRQSETLLGGGKILQETRGWNEKTGKTFSQRSKEESHDYRYFPEPDLPPMRLSAVPEFQNLELPELPRQKRERYRSDFGIKDEDIESFVVSIPLGQFFESVARVFGQDKEAIKLASNYITSDIVGILKTEPCDISPERIGKLDASDFADMVMMARKGEISSRGMKDILPAVLREEMTAREIAQKMNVFQKSDEGELKKIVERVIGANEKAVKEYQAGKEQSLQFLVGQAMKESKGGANPQVLTELFRKVLQ